MLNYIRAELWKVARQRGLWVLVAALLLCTGLFTWVYSAGGFADLVAAASTTMFVGVLVAPLLAWLVDDRVSDTLKNELSFGLGREKIYWGKLLSGLILGLGLCLLLLGGCLCGGLLFASRGDPVTERESLALVGFCLVAAIPLWCGMYALCHALALLVHNAEVWVSGYYVLFFLSQPILVVLALTFFGGRTDSWQFGLLQSILMPYAMLMPDMLVDLERWAYQLWCWGIGLGWLTVSTVGGLLWFQRKDVR